MKKIECIAKKNNIKNNGDFYCLTCFIHLGQKTNLNYIKEYVRIMIIVA